MKIIIMGVGQSGYELAKRVVDDGHDVVVIDKDIRVLKSTGNKLDCITILNDGDNFEAIKNAGVYDAHFFFALTSYDEVNLIVCRFAKNENPNLQTIAGVKDYSYSSLIETQKELFGIDYIINAQMEAAKNAVKSIKTGIIGNPVLFDIEGFALREIAIPHNSYMCDKTIKEIRAASDTEFIMALIYRSKEYIIPTGDTRVREADIVYFFAHKESLDKIFLTDTTAKDIKRILIHGATDIGIHIAKELYESMPKHIFFTSKDIVVMDDNHKNCTTSVEKLPKLFTVQDNIIDHDSKSNFASYDIFIAVTNNQEFNLVSALYAKTIGIKYSLAVIQKSAYMQMASSLDIDSTISILNSSVDRFIRIINSKHIKGVYSILSGEVEVVEFSIVESSKLKNKLIKDIKFPDAVLILFITRDKNIFIPSGDFEFLEDDVLACIGTRDSIKTLQGLFYDKL